MKKIISALVVICLCFGLLSGITASATGTTTPQVWGGPTDSFASLSAAHSAMSGTGTAENPFIITSGKELYSVIKYTKGGTAYTYKLGNDIYLNAPTVYNDYLNWTASNVSSKNIWDLAGVKETGSPNYSFVGTLDGDGYTIYGLCGSAGNYYASFIPSIGSVADTNNNTVVTIKNLNFKNCGVAGARVGALIVGTVRNADSDITVNIQSCTVSNSIIYQPWSPGKGGSAVIVADSRRPTTITNCAVTDVLFKSTTSSTGYANGCMAAIAFGGFADCSGSQGTFFHTTSASFMLISDCYAYNVKDENNTKIHPLGVLVEGQNEKIGYSATVNNLYTDANITTLPQYGSSYVRVSKDGKKEITKDSADYPIKKITAEIKGDAAKTVMSDLDWTGKKWVTVANGLPVPHAKHKIVALNAVAPSCGISGLTEGKHCTECGTVTVAQEEVKALVHDFSGEWTDVEGGGKLRACLNECGESEYYAEKKQDGINAVTGIDAVQIGSVLNIEELKSGSVYDALGKTLGNTAKQYKAWDITALDSIGGVVQVDGVVTLTFDIPEGFSKNIKVYYFDGADEVEEVAIKQQTATTVTIEAQHLSIYTIVDTSTTPSTTITEEENGNTENTTGNEVDLGIILNGDATALGTTSPKTGESVAVVIVTLILLGCASFIFVKKFCK